MILNRQSFFFEPALSLPYLSQDCMTIAVDYALRYPVFTNRRQVHRLAKRVLKKAEDDLISTKVNKGYNLAMFSKVVATETKLFEFCLLNRLSSREYETAEERRTPLWKRLKDHIFTQFLQIDDY